MLLLSLANLMPVSLTWGGNAGKCHRLGQVDSDPHRVIVIPGLGPGKGTAAWLTCPMSCYKMSQWPQQLDSEATCLSLLWGCTVVETNRSPPPA